MTTLGKHWKVKDTSKMHHTAWNKGLKGYFPEEQHYEWKGENCGYVSLHKWVRKHLGIPLKCKKCNKLKTTSHSIHWANKGHTYKRNLKDWIPLCVPCHRKYDGVTKKK